MAAQDNQGERPRDTDERAESLRLAREAVNYLNAFIAYLEPIIEQEIARTKALAEEEARFKRWIDDQKKEM